MKNVIGAIGKWLTTVSTKVSSFKYRKVAFLVASLVVIGGLAYVSRSIFVAALVNGKPITRLALIRELEKQGGKSVLSNLVDKELIFQEAKKSGITITTTDVDKEIKNIEDSLKNQGLTLDSALAARGQTRADLVDQIKVQKTVEALLAPNIKISDEEAQKYFDENKSLYGTNAKFDDVKDQVKNQLFVQKLTEEYNTWIAQLKTKSKIEYFLNF